MTLIYPLKRWQPPHTLSSPLCLRHGNETPWGLMKTRTGLFVPSMWALIPDARETLGRLGCQSLAMPTRKGRCGLVAGERG